MYVCVNSAVIVFHVFLKGRLILTDLLTFSTFFICYCVDIVNMIAQTPFVFEMLSTVRAYTLLLLCMNITYVPFKTLRVSEGF